MKRRVLVTMTMTMLAFVLAVHPVLTQPSASRSSSAKSLPTAPLTSLSNAEMGLLNINNISAWARRDGWSGRIPATGNSGTFYPRGTGSVVFQDGIVWGGIVHDTRDTSLPQRRVGGFTYVIGTVPGWIVTPGTLTTPPAAINPDHPRARIYKIRRDWQTLTAGDPDIIMEAAEFNNTSPGGVTAQMAQAIVDRYALDWNEWPGDLGAPFYDLNGNSTWDLGVDRPGLQNADQVLWFVINDLDTAKTRLFHGSPPIGLEVQTTLWGYKAEGIFGEALYRRTRIINKSGFLLDSMYVAQWSDPDLGNAGDDFAGCDTTLDMTFVYNGDANDSEYETFGLRPPSLGYVLMQGPVLPTGGMQDTALFDFRRVPGARNDRMSAALYDASGNTISNPPFGRYEGTRQWLNLLKGLTPISGTPFVYPGVPGPTTFWLDGDPLAGTGRVDGFLDSPGDRRLGLCAGPFTAANGDTQEVVIALVGGIRHTGDHISSFAEMKQNVTYLRSFYGKSFDVPDVARWATHPTDTTTQLFIRVDMTTQIGVTGADVLFSPETGSEPSFPVQLYDDGLHNDSLAGDGIWGNSIVKSNYKYPVKGDLVVHLAVGSPPVYAGLFSNVPVRPLPVFSNMRVAWENGRQDSTLNHNETIHAGFDIVNPDGLHSIDTLRITNLAPGSNGQVLTYHASIPPHGTASNPSFFFILNGPDTGDIQELRSLVRFDYASEGWTLSLPVVAWTPGPDWGDTLEVTALRGVPYNVKPVVADAAELTGHTYLITFFQSGPDVRWRLYDQTLGQLKLDNGVISASPSYSFPVIDGVQYRVMDGNASPGVADFQTVANASGPLIPPEGAAAAFAGFPVFADPTERQQVGPAEWLIHTGAGGIVGDYYSRFLPRVFRGDNFTRFVPFDFELRFTAHGGHAWLAFTSGNVIGVPFEVWNIGTGTPDDPSDDHRMIPWLNDADMNEVYDLDDIDHYVSGDANDPETDWVYWYDPMNRTPGDVGYQTEFFNRGAAYDGTDGNGNFHEEVMARIVLVNWDGGTPPGPYNQLLPEEGTVFRIISRKPNFAGDSLGVIAVPLTVPPGEDPLSIYLDQNYPNPFNPITAIRFGLTARSQVELQVFNILGQKIRTLVSEEMEPGNHRVLWDARADGGAVVASGVYFYRLRVGEFAQARKMILLK